MTTLPNFGYLPDNRSPKLARILRDPFEGYVGSYVPIPAAVQCRDLWLIDRPAFEAWCADLDNGVTILDRHDEAWFPIQFRDANSEVLFLMRWRPDR